MAIREVFRKAMRRSDASGSSQPESNANLTTTTAATSSSKTSVSSKSSASNKLTRTWTWSSNTKQEPKERKPKNRNKNNKRVHPSEKPLTAQNLKHQEMLSQFTWTFGASSPDQIESASFIGISPCCTRTPSLVDFDGSTDSDGGSSSQSTESDC